MHTGDDWLHVYPESLDLPDLQHEEPGSKVEAPLRECALCRIGACMQLLVRGDVVVHALSPTTQ